MKKVQDIERKINKHREDNIQNDEDEEGWKLPTHEQEMYSDYLTFLGLLDLLSECCLG